MRRAITLTAATAALVVGGAGTATAEPPGQSGTPLVCNDGHTYEVVLVGNGDYTPALVVGSTRVLVPTAFGATTVRTVSPGAPDVVTTSPPTVKGGGNVARRNPQPTVTCSFEITIPQGPGSVVIISGSVTAFFAGPG
jgi:hypothetical protein